MKVQAEGGVTQEEEEDSRTLVVTVGVSSSVSTLEGLHEPLSKTLELQPDANILYNARYKPWDYTSS